MNATFHAFIYIYIFYLFALIFLVSSLFAYLNTAGQAIDNQDYTTASDELQTCR